MLVNNMLSFPLTNLKHPAIVAFTWPIHILIKVEITWPHNVPDENIGKNLEDMCIRRGNLKYLDDEIVNANLKKQTSKLFTLMDAILRYAGSVEPDF
jgi:hypothetical protein